MGQLRALENLGVMTRVDYLVSVSGGSWAGAIYMFARGDTVAVLGLPAYPQKLTLAKVKQTPPLMGVCATSKSPSERIWDTGATPSELVWESVIGDTFLKPFELDSNFAYMAKDEASVERIRRANPQLRGAVFYTPRPDRPKGFVMHGAQLAPTGYMASEKTAVSLQMSPDFTGSPFHPNGSPITASGGIDRYEPAMNVLVGGGLVETFAFGGDAPSDESGGLTSLPAPMAPFTLVRAVAISSAGFGGALSQANGVGLSVLSSAYNIKEMLWPVTSASNPQHTESLDYQVGDGGNIDDFGIVVALQRGASRVIGFLNTNIKLGMNKNYCWPGVAMDDLANDIPSELGNKFGYTISMNGMGQYLGNNQVFKKGDLPPLLCEFQRLRRAGRPLFVTRRLELQRNSWWGITGGSTVEVMFVLNEKCPEWESYLPKETQVQVGKNDLKDFPLLDTTSHYTNAQVNLLAAQAEYTVMNHRGEIVPFLTS